MRLPKLIHFLAIAGLLYWTGITIREALRSHPASFIEGLSADAPMILMWMLFTVMVFLKPRQWGIWVGILMLFGVGSMALAWHGAAANPHPAASDLDWSWLPFLRWAAPNLVTAFCCISLRWMRLEKQDPAPRSE
jgi:hypothetical protein